MFIYVIVRVYVTVCSYIIISYLFHRVYIVVSMSSCLCRRVYFVVSMSSRLCRRVYVVVSTLSCIFNCKYFVKLGPFLIICKFILRGFDELLQEGKAYLDGLFQYSTFNDCLRCLHKGCLLICSNSRTTASGCGRTALAKALCNVFQSSPYFCHIENIDCIPLRGRLHMQLFSSIFHILPSLVL